MNTTTQLSERQLWDTDTSFYIFETYYRPLPPNERTLIDAYRNYRAAKGLSKVGMHGKLKTVPGTWRNWNDGKDPKGRKLPGTVFENSVTWPVRARAYDNYLIGQARKAEEEIWTQRQLQIRRAEWEASQGLLERFNLMSRAPVFRHTITDSAQEGGQVINRTIIIEPAGWKESDIARTVEEASRLARKAAEMDQEKVSVGDWRQELAQAGVDPDLFYDLLVTVLAAQEAGVSLQQMRSYLAALVH